MCLRLELPDDELAYIKLLLIANGSKRAKTIANKIEVDMGKGSSRRPENKNKFDENFDKIFGKPEKKKIPYRTKPDYPPVRKGK